MSVNFFQGGYINMRCQNRDCFSRGDSDVWSLPKGTVLDDDKLYCVKYETHYPSDPADCSSFTRVFAVEEVPSNILEALQQVKYNTSIINEYKRKFN